MDIIEKPFLHNRTTIRLGGYAYQEIVFTQYTDADAILLHLEKEQMPYFVLGGGSNLLIDTNPLEAIVVSTAYMQDIVVREYSQTHLQITAPLAMPLQRFVLLAIKAGVKGFEGLAGIPGSLGGAVAMNAGSFGCEITKYLHSLDILSFTKGICTYSKEECSTGYRTFIVPNEEKGYMGVSATFLCPKENSIDVRSIFANNLQKKRKRQPLQEHSAGCIFKNPSNGESAGKMLEAVGMKTVRSKHFHFSSLHANFLLHDGKGTFTEAMELIEEAIYKVNKEYSHKLELEVRFWKT